MFFSLENSHMETKRNVCVIQKLVVGPYVSSSRIELCVILCCVFMCIIELGTRSAPFHKTTLKGSASGDSDTSDATVAEWCST